MLRARSSRSLEAVVVYIAQSPPFTLLYSSKKIPPEYTIEGEVSFDQLGAWVKRHEEAEEAGQPLPEPTLTLD